jgi:predicted DsbA family dithiol-disulfide isomerase
MITRHTVAAQLTHYLHQHLTLEEMVDWANQAMMDEEFDDQDFDVLRDIISRLGLSDVREFGLTWDDCLTFLARLGYLVRVEVSEVA